MNYYYLKQIKKKVIQYYSCVTTTKNAPQLQCTYSMTTKQMHHKYGSGSLMEGENKTKDNKYTCIPVVVNNMNQLPKNSR